ncbi:MAG: DUF134 domain-containing protein [Actinomycetota bacterium]|nr:DUF134 domain-containing protein [Actinomycetota bacterium]
MVRPVKCRRVSFAPDHRYFKPAGVPLSELAETVLSLDELEAVRLADLEGLYQEEAAKRMNVSRQTFGNILSSARRKIAESLVEGKALKIEGGQVHLAAKRIFTCHDCGHRWGPCFGERRPLGCEVCQGKNIYRSK